MKRKIILASTSPRRKMLMGVLGIEFEIIEPNYKEIMRQNGKHEKLVEILALGKAKSIIKKHPHAVVIAADTIVSFGGKALGKPKTKKEATEILKKLSNTKNVVVTGTVVIDGRKNKIYKNIEKTEVLFKKLSSEQIKKYIATGDPMDKAGSYAIFGKGTVLIKDALGDLTNAMGLPINFIYQTLLKIDLW